MGIGESYQASYLLARDGGITKVSSLLKRYSFG